MHGPKGRRRALLGYALQLQEKQKVRHMYGLMERQLRGYAQKATQKKGDTGIILKQLLEVRLDNAVYRLGFAETRAKSRQLVGHGHIRVNGKKLDIPSYSVKEGDLISVREDKRETKLFDSVRKNLNSYTPPSWLKLDPTNWTGQVLCKPTAGDTGTLFDARPIIEFYSR